MRIAVCFFVCSTFALFAGNHHHDTSSLHKLVRCRRSDSSLASLVVNLDLAPASTWVTSSPRDTGTKDATACYLSGYYHVGDAQRHNVMNPRIGSASCGRDALLARP